MTKLTDKEKVNRFIQKLDDNKFVHLVTDDESDPVFSYRETDYRNFILKYEGNDITDIAGPYKDGNYMIVVPDGPEDVIEVVLTPTNIKRIIAYKKFKF